MTSDVSSGERVKINIGNETKSKTASPTRNQFPRGPLFIRRTFFSPLSFGFLTILASSHSGHTIVYIRACLSHAKDAQTQRALQKQPYIRSRNGNWDGGNSSGYIGLQLRFQECLVTKKSFLQEFHAPMLVKNQITLI